jgi:hypothetical protein
MDVVLKVEAVGSQSGATSAKVTAQQSCLTRTHICDALALPRCVLALPLTMRLCGAGEHRGLGRAAAGRARCRQRVSDACAWAAARSGCSGRIIALLQRLHTTHTHAYAHVRALTPVLLRHQQRQRV